MAKFSWLNITRLRIKSWLMRFTSKYPEKYYLSGSINQSVNQCHRSAVGCYLSRAQFDRCLDLDP